MLNEFVQSVKDTVKESSGDMHTAFPGEIVSVDYATGTATVLPKIKLKTTNGGKIDFPQISGVPICIPQGSAQGTVIAYPVNPGDGCLLVIAEQSLDYWMYGRDTDTDLAFDITNAMCIPGLFPKVSPILAEACSSNSVIISSGGASLRVGNGGVSVIGSLTVSGSINAQSVSAGGVSLSSHTHVAPVDGGETSGPSN